MSEDTVAEANPAANQGNSGLLPETNKHITSMADAFKEAMGSTPAAETPAESTEPAETTPPEPAEPAAEEKAESRSSKDFKLIKQERDEARKQLEEMGGKVSELELKTSSSEEYEQLKTQFDELNEVLSVSNLERHPKFKAQYVKPINDQIERATAYVPEEQRQELVKILKMPVSAKRADALDELTGELPASRQAYLQSAINRIDEVAHERDERLQESAASYEQLLADEKAGDEAKAAERNKALERSFGTMLREAQDNIPIYQLREGDEEWNTSVRERVNLAKRILMEQNSFEDAATAALWAASGGALVEQNAGLVEHNRRLQVEVNTLKGAEPEAAGGTDGGKPQPVKNSSFSDKVMGELRELGIRGAQ